MSVSMHGEQSGRLDTKYIYSRYLQVMMGFEVSFIFFLLSEGLWVCLVFFRKAHLLFLELETKLVHKSILHVVKMFLRYGRKI